MEEFRLIYKILKALKECMDYEEIDPDRFTAEALGITEEKRNALFALLQKEGLIEGVTVREYINSPGRTVIINPSKLSITLKGLQYLEDNSMMKKASNIAKGILGALN